MDKDVPHMLCTIVKKKRKKERSQMSKTGEWISKTHPDKEILKSH